jgi:predicted nucleotidyltransferase component of viral defense system
MTLTSVDMPDYLLTRQQLTIINKNSLRYPLDIAEKDYFLSLALRQLYKSGLKHKLVFKGGTAIHHCYIRQYRFSEDFDFTSLGTGITLDEIVEALQQDGLFKANKTYVSKNTIKIERLQYAGVLGQPGNIKIEVDFKQNIVLSGGKLCYENVWGTGVFPLVMRIEEVCAEKIRAAAQRARYRDFYDLFFLINELKVNTKKAISLLKKKEIRSPISTSAIKKNWEIAREEQADDLRGIYCLKKMLQELNFEPIKST